MWAPPHAGSQPALEWKGSRRFRDLSAFCSSAAFPGEAPPCTARREAWLEAVSGRLAPLPDVAHSCHLLSSGVPVCPCLPLALSVPLSSLSLSLCSPLPLFRVRVSALLGSGFLYWCKPRGWSAVAVRVAFSGLMGPSWAKRAPPWPHRQARPLRICPPPSPRSTTSRETAAVWAAAWRGQGHRGGCAGERRCECF